MFVVCSAGNGLCDGLITRSRELCCVCVCVCVCVRVRVRARVRVVSFCVISEIITPSDAVGERENILIKTIFFSTNIPVDLCF